MTTPQYNWYAETEDGNILYYLVAADATVDLTKCNVQLLGINGTCAATTINCFDPSFAARGTLVAADTFTLGTDGNYSYTGVGTTGFVETGVPSVDATTGVTTYPADSFSSLQALTDSGVCESEGFSWGCFLLILALIGALAFGAKWYMDQQKKKTTTEKVLNDEEDKFTQA